MKSILYILPILGFVLGELFGALVFFIIALAIYYSYKKYLKKKQKFDNRYGNETYKNYYSNYGFQNDSKSAGYIGEKLFQEELRKLKGDIINGYITSKNIFFDDQNFEIDFLVLVKKLGW